MNDLINKLLAYKSDNDFEEAEKLAFANFLKKNDDAYFRTNTIAHITASSWIVNEDFSKVLMCYHTIYKSWSWTGGHADGDKDLKAVAIREAKEETGIENIEPIVPDFYDVEVIPVPAHYKRGFAVGNHLHLNVTYLLKANERDILKVKEDENTKVAWIDVNKLDELVEERDMLPLYHRLHRKALACRNSFKV